MRILIRHVLSGVEHQNDDVGGFDSLQGLNDRKLLDGFEYTTLASHARRIDQLVFLVAAFELDLDRIARGTWLVKSNHPLFTQQRIDQGRLANVRAAGNGHTGNTFGVVCVFRILREFFQRIVDQTPHPFAMRGRNRMRFTQTQFMKVGRHHAAIHAFYLIDGNENGTIDPAEQLGNVLVERRDALATIDHENNPVCFVDGLLSLARHFLRDAFTGFRLETTRVDRQKALASDLAVTIVTIAGQPRHIGYNGITRTR